MDGNNNDKTLNDTMYIQLIISLKNKDYMSVLNLFDDPIDPDKKCRLRKRCNLLEFVYFFYCFYYFSQYQYQVKRTLYDYLQKKFKCCPKYILVECLIDDWNLASISHIDTKWCNRIQYLVTLKMDLEESLSWLSTLGGAYSSLGDKNIIFAKEAEVISMLQMRLSSIYGDPNLTAKCLIYLSHSWSQQGKRSKAIKLIKHYLYPFIIQLGYNCDPIVKRMYKALCFRIRFIY